MKSLINLPSFIYFDKDLQNLNKSEKLFLLLKGIYFIFVMKFINGKAFCFCCNLIYRRNGKIFFSEGKYFKKINDSEKIYYPNKRIDRVMVDHEKNFNNLYKTYLLDKVNFEDNDLVIDCGANVGELKYALNLHAKNIEYLAFEPDKDVYECLVKNMNNKSTLINKALSMENTIKHLYIDSDGANTSLVDFGSNNNYEVETITLDSLKLKNIKLLKIDAEGYEPEVLEGAKNTLKEIAYISVDYGNERGVEEKSTMVEVTNLLYLNNFKLIADSNIRKVGLFKNNNLEA